MKLSIYRKEDQAYGEFNKGEIVENKPIGFPQDDGVLRPFSSLIYWAHAKANAESTIELHPHSGFEITTFVLKGRIHHFDTKKNSWNELNKGDVQIIQSGNGISHAEKMEKNAEIFQIWFDPNLEKSLKLDATYTDYSKKLFKIDKSNKVGILHYNKKLNLLTEDIKIKRVFLEDTIFKLQIGWDRIIGLYVLEGEVTIEGNTLQQYSFAKISDTETVQISSKSKSSIFIINGPEEPEYKIYGSY